MEPAQSPNAERIDAAAEIDFMNLATSIDEANPRQEAANTERDSRVRLRAPEPPPGAADPFQAEPDFIEFLCGRFSLDRESGTELLSQLVQTYEPKGSYSINTLDCQNDQEGIAC